MARVSVSLAALALALTYGVLFLPEHLIELMAGREMVLETLGAFLFLGASVASFVGAHTARTQTSSRAGRGWLILLGALFFLAFAEELSWGQHILGYEVPDKIAEANRQREMNIHNLFPVDSFERSGEKKKGLGAWLSSNRLFDYFMIGLFLILPALARADSLGTPLEKLRLPIMPMALGVVLVANFALTGLSEVWLVDGEFMHLAVSEIRETNYAVLCLLGMSAIARGRSLARGQT